MSTKQSAFGRPATLWELCEQTVEAILTRPLNYYQDEFCVDAKDYMLDKKGDALKDACGTAYCRSGWMGTILGLDSWEGLAYVPEKLLIDAGISMFEIGKLFDATGGNNYISSKMDHAGCTPGTKAYARAGAAGLKKFMRKHREKLKAARLMNLAGEYSVRMED